MNKNSNHPMNDIINEFTEKFGDKEVRMTFRTVKEGMDSYFGLIEMTAELVRLIREEETLRKHHRAYLHVREAILDGCNELMAYINAELTKCGEERHFRYIPKSEYSDGYPFAEAEDADDDEDEETVTIPKEQYEDMIDDLLTMAELIDMVSDMRIKDVRAIQEKDHLYRVTGMPSAFDTDEDGEDEDDFVTIPKEKYDSMIEDLLTMAELLGMVADMRTKDVRAIQEFGKYVPAFAAFEKNRLSLYREAAKEAEDILTRWEDEIDEDDESDEYFSD